MKKIMITGGLGGFGLGLTCGLLTQGSSWPAILWRASVAALLGGWLLRWWFGVLARCCAQARAEKQAAAAAQREVRHPLKPAVR